jgi:hypothetical protein
MDVYFRFTNGEHRAAHKIKDHRISFTGGVYKTTDKEIITDILSSDLYKRGELVMVGDSDTISNYLAGQEPDYLAKELVYSLPDDCVKELAAVCGTREKKAVMIIRAELIGLPITDEVSEVIDQYSINNEPVIDIVAKGLEEGLVTKNKRWYSFDSERIPDTKATIYKEEVEQILYNYYKGLE